MRLLLDSCSFLWLRIDDPRVSEAARSAAEDPANEVFLSAASAMEIALKQRLGKLLLAEEAQIYIPNAMEESGARPLGISVAHGLRAGCLPFHHKDPFDRILVAQCELEGLTMVSPIRFTESTGSRSSGSGRQTRLRPGAESIKAKAVLVHEALEYRRTHGLLELE